ncbi:expression site-associated gene (ESAG) protein, putative [Trypanosoma brucei brucei TREU927]|uniref:Expression site-associated gene (ESAG) protein, putative n=1 Tax=Trypanosoma brucei brucei (strain 927/4 GUTat10.1) TaxID=185431 RepID=Q57X43_TRYB2|nr:expression site-associated gene (ESAG) protein, putative [Trypanosoma brucei brucei TREU927]AAX69833.1 expression site-associated gene (ESAG) protein, putative [Trypanosoma brucei]AAZ11572.1 expression site-associated gene (ESAG) protein, putative [Trypanosoma brucei brucei TREU927]
MKITIVELVILLFFAVNIDGEGGACMLLADVENDVSLDESVCYLSCLSSALSKLYTDGERKMFVNEEVYANASRILDDMEWKSGESATYLSVISGVMEGKHDKLEKLISYGSAMGDLVAKVGGLFVGVNESVRAVRNAVPDALITANKYYTAAAEVERTVWDDVKGMEAPRMSAECSDPVFTNVAGYKVICPDYVCPFNHGVTAAAFRKYKNECLEITVYYPNKCRAQGLPRGKLYGNGIVKNLTTLLEWRDDHSYFQLTLKIRQMLDPLIVPFASGFPPSVLVGTLSNITSLYSHFNEVYSNFTSLLLGTNTPENVNRTNFPI